MTTIRQDVKSRAADCPSERPTKIVCKAIKGIEESLTTKDLKNMRKTISRQKLSSRPPRPTSQEGTLISLRSMKSKEEFKDFIGHVDVTKKIVVFCTTEGIEQLFEENVQVFGDGTFAVCPKYFKQLYTFIVYKNRIYSTCVYFLLPNKQKITYVSILNILKLKTGQTYFSTLCVDFESAMILAIKEVMPETRIRGCHFHLGQNWWRKYRNNV